MPDSKNMQHNCFKEAVCINAGRVFDSCSDKDCLEDLQVHFTPLNQAIIDGASNVKCKSIQVFTVLMDVESVPFNKGFYSVDMTFYFHVKLEAVMSPMTPCVSVDGISVFCKKVILYGSEGNVNVFSSENATVQCPRVCACDANIPKATINVVNPICLACRLCNRPDNMCEVNFSCPSVVNKLFDDEFDCVRPQKVVYVSLGLFSIVQLERAVQMMIPVYDYCIPDKECVSTTDDPCELFKKIKFPVNEFFPKTMEQDSCNE